MSDTTIQDYQQKMEDRNIDLPVLWGREFIQLTPFAFLFLTMNLIDLSASYSFKNSLLAKYMDPNYCNQLNTEDMSKARCKFIATMTLRLIMTLGIFICFIAKTRDCQPILFMLII